MRLTDKTAIITGGAQGFGAGIVDKFLAEGARVLVADINGDAATTKAGEHTNATACRVDVADGASVQAMIDQAVALWGHVDIIVNNAGVTHLPAPMDDITESDFDRVFAVNCKSIYLIAQSLVGHMKTRSTGAILNISSTAGLSPRPNLSWYNASKGWVTPPPKPWRSSLRHLASASTRSILWLAKPRC